jgi:hypothetical protein
MAERKSFLLRVDREVLDAVQRWANDDLRSLNGHIEFLLRQALRDAGRLPKQRSSLTTPEIADERIADADALDDTATADDSVSDISSQ